MLAAFLPALGSAAGDGRAVFDAHGCRACHRIGPVGSDVGPDLTLVGLRRSRRWIEVWLSDPSAWKKDALMPHPRLGAGSLEALALYLSERRGQDWKKAPPWRGKGERTGRLVYTRAGCAACHGARGEGGHPNNNVLGGLIPALADVAWTYTPEELQTRIRRGAKPVPQDPAGPAPLVEMPAWEGVLQDDEIEAVAAYVRGLSPEPAGQEW